MKWSRVLVLLLALLGLLGISQALAEEVTPVPTQALIVEDAPELHKGSRDGEDTHTVKQLQERLIWLGYLDDVADGIFGGRTEAALKEFQAQNNLQETGTLTPATETLLFSDHAQPMPTPEPTPLTYGAKGEDVLRLQARLKAYGFLADVADGSYGRETETAVKAYQNYLNALNNPMPTPAPDATAESTMDVTIAPTETPAPDPDDQTAPAPTIAVDGIADDHLQASLNKGTFEVFREEVSAGSKGTEVSRVQRRLTDLGYLADNIDGTFGQNTEDALKYFQQRNGLEETGVADEDTQRILFSDSAVVTDNPMSEYLLKVSVSDQRVYAYKWTENGYTNLVRTMICSTGAAGTPTPTGTYQAAGQCGGRWYYFEKYQCWAQYAFRIQGPYLFHSVIYSAQDERTLRKSSYNLLGARASHGCVRLAVEDAKWIYEHCTKGTTVKIY